MARKLVLTVALRVAHRIQDLKKTRLQEKLLVRRTRRHQMLRRSCRRQNQKPILLMRPIRNGFSYSGFRKQGWYLKIPTYGNWLVEPQVGLGPDKGISVSSRADFVLYPERPKEGERPIAVFTDGYEYHADPISGNMRVARDSAQRLGIAPTAIISS